MHHRSFEEHDVYSWNGALHQIFEQYPLPAMRPEIPAIKETLAFGFDKEGIGISSGVVNQIRSNSEFPYLKRLPGLEVPEVALIFTFAKKYLGCINEVLCQPAHVHRSVRRKAVHQAEVVLMGMADQNGVYFQLRDIDYWAISTEGESNIEKNCGLAGGDLNTGSTDFVSTLMDEDFHSTFITSQSETQ